MRQHPVLAVFRLRGSRSPLHAQQLCASFFLQRDESAAVNRYPATTVRELALFACKLRADAGKRGRIAVRYDILGEVLSICNPQSVLEVLLVLFSCVLTALILGVCLARGAVGSVFGVLSTALERW